MGWAGSGHNKVGLLHRSARYQDRLVRAPPSLQIPFLIKRLPVEDLRRRPVAQGLMRPPFVVEPEVFTQLPVGLNTIGMGFQIYLPGRIDNS